MPGGDTSVDEFLGGQIAIRQPRRGYRAGIDPILLAAAVHADEGRRTHLLDAGAGVGTAGLAVASRHAGVHATLVERDAQLAALARENAVANGLADRVEVIGADLTAPLDTIAELEGRGGTFQHVIANPPFLEGTRGSAQPAPAKAAAHVMPSEGLERWARFLAAMAAPDAFCTIIHRADALNPLLTALQARFGGLLVYPIFPRAGDPAIRVIVQGIKGSRAPLVLLPGLVLHEASREGAPRYTREAEAVLRHGARLNPAKSPVEGRPAAR